MSEETREIQVQEADKQVAETESERRRERPTFVPRADIYENDKIDFYDLAIFAENYQTGASCP